MRKIDERILYLIISEEYCRGRSAIDIAGDAITGGVDMIQLREKTKTPGEIIQLARGIKKLCVENNVKFIVNDDPAIAKEAGAHGVHLGQDDAKRFTIAFARKILGKDAIIGLSTSSIEEVERANAEDVDYIGFGPVFPTVVKENCVGIKDIEKVLKTTKKPVFFIGGINLSNVDELLMKGAKNIAVIRAISASDDVKTAAGKLKEKMEKA
jgi:thiamine-phosphate pyrophosphorylase